MIEEQSDTTVLLDYTGAGAWNKAVLEVGHEKLEEHIKEVRVETHNAALERAAKVCETFDFNSREEIAAPKTLARYCAAAIRALKVEK